MKKNNKKRVAPLFKKLNGKRVPVCDYGGTCTNKAFKEVYPEKGSWNYLCKKHFNQEHKNSKKNYLIVLFKNRNIYKL